MNSETSEVVSTTDSPAQRFVDLVIRKESEWDDRLNAAEEKILLELVSAAGFHPKAVVFGRLRGNYRDQDGSITGETYPINALCCYKVINAKGHDDVRATGWLDCALRFVLNAKRQPREEIISLLHKEITLSHPLTPITLTEIGDTLQEYPPSLRELAHFPHLVSHTNDNTRLATSIGIAVHAVCSGWIDRTAVSTTHDILRCQKCGLRVPFPKEIATYGELRRYFAQYNPPHK